MMSCKYRWEKRKRNEEEEMEIDVTKEDKIMGEEEEAKCKKS